MQKISARLQNAKALTEDVYQFDFSLEEPLAFQAGQFLMLKVDDGEKPVNRAYSIASPPNQTGGFSLCIKLIPGGRGSEYLRKAQVGDEMEFTGPFGHFVLQDSSKDIVMLGTGTGLAPFMSMLPILFEQGFKGSIQLYFGVRHESDLFYQEELSAWAKEHPNFTPISTLSRPEEGWEGSSGRITEYFQTLDLDPGNTKLYICGNGQMVKDVKALGLEKGLDKKSIHLEQFTSA